MNRNAQSAADPDSPRSELSHQCTLYLLGELSGQSLTEFEHRLSDSADLGELLISQAALIEELSLTRLASHPDPLSATLPLPATSTSNRWIMIATSAALAACVGWVLFSLRPNQPGPETVVDVGEREALLIAKVWADDSATTAFEVVPLASVEEEAPLEIEDDLEIDSTLSWMFVAVAAETDSFAEGDANDG